MTQSSTVPPVYDNRLYDQNPSMREIAFHEKAARSQVGSFAFSLDKVFLRPSRHCHHPSIRTLDERFSLGASWAFSFQPVLPPDYRPAVRFLGIEPGPGVRRSHRNSAFELLLFLSKEMFFGFVLRRCPRHAIAVVQRFVHFSAHP